MKKPTCLFLLLALLCAASSFAGISVDHDKSADFSKYKTFTIKVYKAVDKLFRHYPPEAE